jgi:hypothetical protein
MDPVFVREFGQGVVEILKEVLAPLQGRIGALEAEQNLLRAKVAALEAARDQQPATLKLVNDGHG